MLSNLSQKNRKQKMNKNDQKDSLITKNVMSSRTEDIYFPANCLISIKAMTDQNLLQKAG